jgi:methionyl aminopeptidase
MINMGTRNIKRKDGWTITTADGRPSAPHFEHDVAIIDGKPEILTFAYVYKALEL